VRQQEAEQMTREVLSTSTSHPLSLQAPSLAGGRPHSSALIRVARLFACTQFGFTGPFYMDDGSMETPEYNKTGIPTLKTRPQ
jgi:hypothetical protein